MLKTNRIDLIENLQKDKVTAEQGYFAPDAIRIVLGETAIHDLDTYKNGHFMVQDEAPMMASVLAEPKPMQEILDLCAAPGGKTTYLAELCADQASIIAVDINASRTRLIDDNLSRLGIEHVTTLSSDVLSLQETYPEWQSRFDVV